MVGMQFRGDPPQPTATKREAELHRFLLPLKKGGEYLVDINQNIFDSSSQQLRTSFISNIKEFCVEKILMPVELIILIAAIVVSWLVFTALIKIVKTTATTAIAIAGIILALQLVFGIGYQDLWQQITQLPQIIWNLVTGG